MRATGVGSTTLNKEIDKRIADLLLDDEMLVKAHQEIEAGTERLGNFDEPIVDGG
jgi:hypothetical protein